MRVLPLDDTAAAPETVGGKGASLARLARAGLPVPDGFHITTDAYREFVAPFRDRILAALDEPAKIADLFARHEMPEQSARAVMTAYQALGDDVPVAVRSSATAEDLPGMSFAGQQDTYLNVRGAALLDAVRRCWASLWTERAIAYRTRNRVSHDDVALAVVVQKLVAADAAGVMFTANPVNGVRDEIVVNAAWGLGEAVVGGQVTPDSLVIRQGRVVEERVADKTVMTVRTPDGTAQRPVPMERRRLPVLAEAQAVRLAGLGDRIQRLYGTPMDVEWAALDGELFILQARPVTGLQEEVEEWNDSRRGDHLWTAGNLGEAIPDVMTPATWSFVQLFIHEAMSASTLPGFDLVGNIGGRFYMNLGVTVSVARALGMGSRLSAVEQVFGKIPPGLNVPMVRVSRWKIIKAVLPMALRIRKRVAANLKDMQGFLATARRRNEELRARIEAVESPAELARLWERELLPYFVTACRMLEAAGRQGGATLVWTRDRLRRMAGELDAEAMLTGVNADGELASMGPIMGLDRLARREITRDEFARAYGHRGPHEFEVSAPRPGEDHAWIDAQLAGLSGAHADTGELLRRQAAARDAAWARFARRHPRQVVPMRARVARWNAVVRDRESTRSEVIRAFWALRAFVLKAGTLTGHGDDLFFLPVEEILDVLRGGRPSRVAVRRATYERYAALPPYPALIVGYFDPVRWAASADRRTDIYDARGVTVEAGGEVTGFPGAPGVVEGTARVIAGPEEGDRLKQGEVLVTTLTNIGWTPMFPRAAAVVTDMGAPLSHASIVARELGIPAVVGTGNATMRIKDGDRVRVDGERGTVEVLPSRG
ncbi:PEP/pyruvate-binding domain-containing protein [Nonomuraea dietziae]|uniref:Pyruvate,water dikinase n=2 Tax=Nonomuraea dietziae TaxID=65515 RepID=A0A7W5V6W2_9ACTN|nr:PEP/pyruvate-binding domain-containing protein [Nonomuraea dietziae]MBB3731701.1 pyruvate,water dikinase [Nonomuraea dietziae]